MKRFIVIIAILALFVPGLVDALQLTQGWNETTVSSNAEIVNSTGAFQHKGLWNVNDDFTGTSIDTSIWNTAVNAGGEVNLVDIYNRVDAISGTSIRAAMLIFKETFKTNEDWGLEAFVESNSVTGAAELFALVNTTSSPVPLSSAAYTNQRTITMFRDAIVYTDNADAFVSWDGSAWQAGAAETFSPRLDRFELQSFDDSGTMKWKIFVYDEDNSLTFVTTPVSWALTRLPGSNNNLWGFYGSARTNVIFDSTKIHSSTRWIVNAVDRYSTSAQIVNTDSFTFDEDFNSDDIQVLVGNTPAAATEFKIYVKEDAGAFSSAINVNTTILASETGWHDFMPGTAFTSHTSVTLRVELNTPNSDLQLKAYAVKIKGVTIAGAGADDKLIGGTLDGF